MHIPGNPISLRVEQHPNDVRRQLFVCLFFLLYSSSYVTREGSRAGGELNSREFKGVTHSQNILKVGEMHPKNERDDRGSG